MPSDRLDEPFARSRVGLPPPVTVGGLLLELGVEGRGVAAQRRAIARWLEAETPAPTLARALLAADLLPDVRQLVAHRRRHPPHQPRRVGHETPLRRTH